MLHNCVRGEGIQCPHEDNEYQIYPKQMGGGGGVVSTNLVVMFFVLLRLSYFQLKTLTFNPLHVFTSVRRSRNTLRVELEVAVKDMLRNYL